MEVVYREIEGDFNKEYPTWIIAFCPDTMTFFATNQRAFFWETREEFDSEDEAVEYFVNNLPEFANIQDIIMDGMFAGYKAVGHDVFLENTEKFYKVDR